VGILGDKTPRSQKHRLVPVFVRYDFLKLLDIFVGRRFKISYFYDNTASCLIIFLNVLEII